MKFLFILAAIILIPALGFSQHDSTWKPPYHLDEPQGWEIERFPLPPPFAKEIPYHGYEDIRFTPGWSKIDNDEHWAYCFIWWLDGTPVIDAEKLQSSLKLYYTGLVASNVPADKMIPVVVNIKKTKTASGDAATYTGTINMLDYHTKNPMTLNCLIHVKDIKLKTNTAVFLELSPQPFTHAVWKKMNDIGASFSIK